jgi:RimJ/RimL family protein N-acetyltransferase
LTVSGTGETVFDTERCVVRNWRLDDAPRFLDTYSRWEVARWLGTHPKVVESLDEAEARITRWAEQNHAAEFGGRWAVERREDGVVLGTVILIPLPDGDGELEVGWHFHPDSWGRGFATEAARGALERAYRHGAEEVFAVVRPDNERSIAVCRRLGMAALGRTTRYYHSELELFLARPGAAERETAYPSG